MWTGPSLQRKGSDRVTPPLQAPSLRPSLLSKLTLAPASCSYLATAFSTTSMSEQWDTKNCDIIDESRDPYSNTTDKGHSDQGRIGLLISKPTGQGLQFKDVEKRRRGSTFGPTAQLRRTSGAFRSPAQLPRGCGTECWSIRGTSVWIRRSPKPPPETDDPPYRKLWTDLNWSARLQCRLLFPPGSREPSAGCLGLIFPSQRSSAQVRPNHWQ